jgi:uncharacterized lipoprotein YmbA
MNTISRLTALTAALFGLALCGCVNLKPTADPTRFFVLSPPLASKPMPNRDLGEHIVAVAAVETPAYLNDPRMVERRGDTQVVYLDHCQWAEPLREGMTRCLRDQLAAWLGPARVHPLNRRWPAGPTLEVQASVSGFEVTDQGRAKLTVRWRIVESPEGAVRHAQASEITHDLSVPASDPEVRVVALGETLAAWSREVAEAIVNARPTTSRP